ncbi:MAG TPA: hypothetical protein DCX06_02450 [Opitutae bacterium]|nr:hypothetical protein [Opitutae bacterium]
MRILLLGVLFGLLASSVQAQEGLQPKYEISPNIAKVPEQSDFFGAWTRGDGGYTIEVAPSAAIDGVVVKYFNPDSINVERSNFDLTGEEPRLQFVLRDTGYPGSSYELSFLSERRVLIGTYSRPGSQPSQVYFINQAE